MASNQERREAARTTLEQTITERRKQERRKKALIGAGAVVGVVALAGATFGVYTLASGGDSGDPGDSVAAEDQGDEMFDEFFDEPQEMPEPEALPDGRAEALPATVDCAYPESGRPAAKEAERPAETGIPAEGTVPATINLNGEPVGLSLDRAKSPCAINSFASLAEQGYFDGTSCHRLTTAGIFVLQCGDPSATGGGGPGYAFADEFPADQFQEQPPGGTIYPRGTIAMANAGPGTNGSQFFLVYDDSPLAPAYSILGQIDDAGLSVIDAIAQAGVDGNPGSGPGDGAPSIPAEITSVTVEE
ncbi:peptidylprolyl isomerase [Hoyosella sp. G463]|uniref:Peptidylprolyl isomerase n=1 Tax=Lolliginicoccus lacisalsi TaxID=2742202 RepID=A0A927JA12_9ACTN|nr:peptidylprolyl isomerase [Lolliginicoccus lacisalsi]